MADYLVLQQYAGIIGNRNYNLTAGEVISDTTHPVTTLIANGAALVLYTGGMAAAVTRFNEAQHDHPEQTVMAVLEANGVIPSAVALGTRVTTIEGRLAVDAGMLYVDPDFGGATSDGSPTYPYTSIGDAITAAVAGGATGAAPWRIAVRGETTEDVTLAVGVNISAWIEALEGDYPPKIIGEVTAAYIGTVEIVGVDIEANGAGQSCLLMNGANATVLELHNCRFVAPAASDQAVIISNANAVLRVRGNVEFRNITANANAVLQITQGTIDARQGLMLWHEDDTSLALEATAAGVTNITIWETIMQGGVDIASAAANPTVNLRGGQILTGNLAAINTASTNVCYVEDIELASDEAGGEAVTGAGGFIFRDMSLTGTALALDPALNAGGGGGRDSSYEHIRIANDIETYRLPTSAGIYVDITYAGGVPDGSRAHPFDTIAAALAAAGAGDTIYIYPGVYVEDLTLVAGVDMIGMAPPRTESVQITGEMTANYIGTVNIANLYLTEAAAATLTITGANATILNIRSCIIESGAGATFACDQDAANALTTCWDTLFRTITGNANETVTIDAGGFQGEQIGIMHADGVTGPVVALQETAGAATNVNLYDFLIQGGVDIDTAAANPTNRFCRGVINVGNLEAINTASTGMLQCYDLVIDSVAAGVNAIVGAGAFSHANLRFINTADEMATTLNAAAGPGEDVQRISQNVRKGMYTEGAGAGARAIAFGVNMPHANYVITITCEDTGAGVQTFSVATGTRAVGGFTINTGGNAIFHWRAELIET